MNADKHRLKQTVILSVLAKDLVANVRARSFASTLRMTNARVRMVPGSAVDSVQQRIRQNVHIDLLAVAHLVAAAAAAAFGVGGVVETVLRVEHAEAVVDADAFQRVRRAAVVQVQLGDVVHRVKDWMIQADR